MLGVIEGFAIILSVIAVGYALARTKVIASQEQRLVLNRVAFYAATPALIFTVVSTTPSHMLVSPVILVSAVAGLLTAGLYFVLSQLFFRMDYPTTVMGAASSFYVNSNNIGLPVAMFVLGTAAYVPPLLLIQMAMFTPVILGLIGPEGRSRTATVLGAVRQALLSPVVLAAFAGLVVSMGGWTVPAFLAEPVSLLGGASIPMILMSFGASLMSNRPLTTPGQRTGTVVAVAMKSLAMPTIAGLVGYAVGLHGNELYAVVIMAALPTAQNIYNYAATFNKGTIIARDTIFLTTFIALPAMLLIAALFGR